ncbi:hypothetical protein M409DRAFT_64185 [Zasmidium cellare ATCC 36951]|uniref:NAD(P)-binding protein n=1 Tax=Zasmidium cellare ATCC 36951 TaxID=1080233 RepID=A0A6A6CTM6_ZASCE|nr:uncharacterized protein M409DRAFT_64185 [Zasmidium cellare ATCC 36951]KAF2170451.1 hypothetical protein M409DRAFT_64185 [Zasmidium cellare ATCC 36951]
MTQQSVVLKTGGNSGFGFAVAEELGSDSTKHILLGCRSAEKGEKAVAELQNRAQATIDFVRLDITDEKSISAAVSEVEKKYGRLDVLVNNAATLDQNQESLALQMASCFETNSTGVALAVDAFLPLLKKSTSVARIINISSGAGSLRRRVNQSPNAQVVGMQGVAYAASKAALNMITLAQAKAYGGDALKVFVYTPGFVISNLSTLNTVENGAKSPKDGALGLVKVINGERDSEHGGFLSESGQYEW